MLAKLTLRTWTGPNEIEGEWADVTEIEVILPDEYWHKPLGVELEIPPQPVPSAAPGQAYESQVMPGATTDGKGRLHPLSAPDGLQLDLATAIVRLEQVADDGPDSGIGSLMLERVLTCDVPRLRGHLADDTSEWLEAMREQIGGPAKLLGHDVYIAEIYDDPTKEPELVGVFDSEYIAEREAKAAAISPNIGGDKYETIVTPVPLSVNLVCDPKETGKE